MRKLNRYTHVKFRKASLKAVAEDTFLVAIKDTGRNCIKSFLFYEIFNDLHSNGGNF